MEKRNNIVIMILAGMLVVVGILAVYFGITLGTSKKDTENLNQKINDMSAALEEKSKENTNLQTDLNKSNEKLDTINETVNGSSSSNTGKSVTNTIIDLNNCLNKKSSDVDGYELNSVNMGTNLNSYCKYTSTEAYVTLSEEFVENIENAKLKYKAGSKIKVEGIDKKIVDVQFLGYSQDITCTVLLFLLEDGTVNYLTYKDMVMDGNFTSSKFSNVSDVIRIQKGTVLYGKEQIGNSIGRLAPFLVRADGSFYDVGELLLDK